MKSKPASNKAFKPTIIHDREMQKTGLKNLGGVSLEGSIYRPPGSHPGFEIRPEDLEIYREDLPPAKAYTGRRETWLPVRFRGVPLVRCSFWVTRRARRIIRRLGSAAWVTWLIYLHILGPDVVGDPPPKRRQHEMARDRRLKIAPEETVRLQLFIPAPAANWLHRQPNGYTASIMALAWTHDLVRWNNPHKRWQARLELLGSREGMRMWRQGPEERWRLKLEWWDAEQVWIGGGSAYVRWLVDAAIADFERGPVPTRPRPRTGDVPPLIHAGNLHARMNQAHLQYLSDFGNGDPAFGLKKLLEEDREALFRIGDRRPPRSMKTKSTHRLIHEAKSDILPLRTRQFYRTQRRTEMAKFGAKKGADKAAVATAAGLPTPPAPAGAIPPPPGMPPAPPAGLPAPPVAAGIAGALPPLPGGMPPLGSVPGGVTRDQLEKAAGAPPNGLGAAIAPNGSSGLVDGHQIFALLGQHTHALEAIRATQAQHGQALAEVSQTLLALREAIVTVGAAVTRVEQTLEEALSDEEEEETPAAAATPPKKSRKTKEPAVGTPPNVFTPELESWLLQAARGVTQPVAATDLAAYLDQNLSQATGNSVGTGNILELLRFQGLVDAKGNVNPAPPAQ